MNLTTLTSERPNLNNTFLNSEHLFSTGHYSMVNYTVPGNRLYQNANCSIEIVGKSIPEVIGEQVLAPIINKVGAITYGIFHLLKKGLNYVDKFTLLPIVAAQSACEWGKAKRILVHQPGTEIEMGVYHPQAALFEKSFNPSKAKAEHQNYIELLKGNDVEVFKVVDLLLKGTINDAGEVIKNSPELEDLKQLAEKSLTYVLDTNFSLEEMTHQYQYHKEIIKELHPEQLVKIILNRPSIHLKKTTYNTFLEATYQTSPLMNLYFLRDQLITTGKGVVIGKMNSSQRANEIEIVKLALKRLGIKPLYEVMETGRLEGGDYLPAGNIAFIGQGLRTNEEAILQLMKNDVFGNIEKLVVVKDSKKSQDQMHLDTFFNIVSSDKAVLVQSRFDNKDLTKIDVWERKEGKFSRLNKDLCFVGYLKDELKFTLLAVPDSDQLKYGINFLTISENKLLGVDGVSEEYKKALKESKVNVTWMDFSALTSGYGAAHCTTQVLERNCNTNHMENNSLTNLGSFKKREEDDEL